MKNIKRYIPLILSLLLIFGLTFQNCKSSAGLTRTTQAVINHVTVTAENENHWWNDYILMRKLGHIPEYVLLGLSACYTFRKWRGLKALGFCVGMSLVDQIIKGILPGREFDFSDMPFDFVGYACGIVVMIVVLKLIYKKITTQENVD